MPLPVMAVGAAMSLGKKLLEKKKGRKAGARAIRGVYRPRRRRGLTARRKADLLWLKANVGRTAAAAYLAQHAP